MCIRDRSVIDPAAGIRLLKKAGDPVKKGDVLARLYAGDAAKFAAAEEKFHSALTCLLYTSRCV